MAHESFRSFSAGSDAFGEGRFDPSSFLIPGWEGGSLASKSSQYLKGIQKNLLEDAVGQFKSVPNFNESLKRNIHREYVNFSQSYQLEQDELEKENVFWRDLYDDGSSRREDLDRFIKKFCLKAVNLYIYKVRFVVALSSENLVPVSSNDLLNPHSFFTRIFCFGGSVI